MATFWRGLASTARWVWALPLPQRLVTGVALTLVLGFALAKITESSPTELQGVSNPSAIGKAGVLVSSGSNPLPDAGFPHGRGITADDFPKGYRLGGVPQPTFDSYLTGKPDLGNERLLLRVCFRRSLGERCLHTPNASNPIKVAPGDVLLVSALVHNNGDSAGNEGGVGPAVAHNTRIYFNFPRGRARELNLGAFVYARNAVVDETRRRLHTISDNMALRSATGKPISLAFYGARVLQAISFDPHTDPGHRYRYRRWYLNEGQAYWMFTGTIRNVQTNAEADPDLGLPVGSVGIPMAETVVGQRQSQRLDFFAGDLYHCFVQFRVRVKGHW